MVSKRRFNRTKEKEICRLYEAGLNTRQLAEKFDCSNSTLYNILKRNNIKTRITSELKKLFTPEEEEKICMDYIEGLGSVVLSKKYNCHQSTILKIVKRNNIETRSRPKWNKKTADDEEEICRLYTEDKSVGMRWLAEKFDCDRSTIKSILERNNIRIKTRGEWRQKAAYEETEICRLYENGLNTNELAEKFASSTHGIINVLKRHQIRIRDRSEVQWKYTPEEEQQICRLYEDGLDIRKISEKIGGGASTISRVLNRHNITIRSNAEYIKILSSKEEQEVCMLYKDGMSSLKIAEKLDCSVGVIIRTLRFHNIEIRIIKGENHPKWLGGVSFEPYCPKFNNEFKERVRAFWNRECGLCGLSEQDNGRKLSVHHVNYEKMVCCDDTPPLFIPLCSSCHAITNHNRRGWEHVLTEYIMIYFNGDSYSKP